MVTMRGRAANDDEEVDAVVVGGGLAGCLLAAELASRGKKTMMKQRQQQEEEEVVVKANGSEQDRQDEQVRQRWRKTRVYELREDPRRASGKNGGTRLRSINLALSMRGLTALDRIAPDVAERLRQIGVPMRGRAIHPKTGNVVLQPYGRTGQALQSVSRATLNELLLDAAEEAGAELRFGMRCVDVDTKAGRIAFEEAAPASVVAASRVKGQPRTSRVRASLIVGADGASSRVRGAMQIKKGFNYSQQYISHGYKELSIPAGPGGTFLMEREALHIWPRDDFMLIALPNENGSFTLTLFMAFTSDGDDKESFESLATDADVLAFFRREFPDAVPLMPTLLEDFRRNPVSSLVTIRCDPWVCDDKVAILGDAAHAIVPFYGQGCNCAFEDVRILTELLNAHGDDDCAGALRAFSESRKKNADTIADLALYNYEEMRSKTNSPLFVARRNLEQYLELFLPTSWQFADLHSLVSFTNISYSDVVRKVARQDRIIDACLSSCACAIAAMGVAASWALVARLRR